jgi:hypothetical protein
MEIHDEIVVEQPLNDAIAYANGHTRVNNRFTMEIPDGTTFAVKGEKRRFSKSPPDKANFSKIRRSGAIKMTDYHVIEERESFSVLREPHLVANRASVHSVHQNGGGWLYEDWDETQGLYFRCFQLTPNSLTAGPYFYHRVKIDESDSNKNRVMAKCVQEASQSLDLLTEFAERKDTILTITSLLKSLRQPLQSYKDAVDFLKNSKKRDKAKRAAELWLGYRYAVMPIVYSIQDAVEVLNQESSKYQTSRAAMKVYGSFADTPSQPGILYDTGHAEIRWSATSKARFLTSELRKTAALGLNPIRTAWELVPYSFVVDWAVNIADLIESLLFDARDFSNERKFCISTRKHFDITTMLSMHGSEVPATTVIDSYGDLVAEWPKLQYPVTHQIAREYFLNSYEREVFEPADVKLDVEPYLDWRRWADAAALSTKPLFKALRRLK